MMFKVDLSYPLILSCLYATCCCILDLVRDQTIWYDNIEPKLNAPASIDAEEISEELDVS